MARFLRMSISKKRSKVKSSKANPRIKKRTKAQLSKAAKKGWETRRAKQSTPPKKPRSPKQIKAFKRNIANAQKKWKKNRPAYFDIPGISEILNQPNAGDVLKAVLKEERKRAKKEQTSAVRQAIREERKKVKKAYEAAGRAIDRTLDKLAKEFTLAPESAIYNRMSEAQDEGRLDDEARILAEEFDWPIQEIYTIFMSP